MGKKSVLREAAQKLVSEGKLNPACVDDLIALARPKVEVLPGVDGKAETYLFADKSGGNLNIEMGLKQMLAERTYLQPPTETDGDKPKAPKEKNPFVGLRDPQTGAINEAQMRKVESFIRAAGTKAAASVARSAGLRLDGTPIPERWR